MAYTSLIPPSSSRPPSPLFSSKSKIRALIPTLQAHISISVWFCLGAVVQSALLFLPISHIIKNWRFYAFLPAIAYLATRLVLALLVTFDILPNPYLKGSILHRYTALVPDQNGNLPEPEEKPSKNQVAVLILGAKINHPFGVFGSPESSKFGELGARMFKELEVLLQSESGFLGQSNLKQMSAEGAVEEFTLSYWRSIEHIHKYAASPKHVEAINWWHEKERQSTESGGTLKHIGIMHEIFEAPAGCWETIYLNFQPTMLGATTYLRSNNGKGEMKKGAVAEEWVSGIVDARRGKLRGSRGRLGWDPRGSGRQVHEKEGEVGDY